MIGRKRPYSQAEIGKVRCRCGKPGAYQWNCCAIENRWVPVCKDCDIGLNEIVLAFFRVPDRDKIVARYRRKVGR